MFGKKSKKEREKQKERLMKMFHMQVEDFRKLALEEKKKLREVYWERHWTLKSRQATNIITADRVGRGERTREIEIDDISKGDSSADQLFRETLDEFIEEVGEVVIRQTVHEEETAELCVDDLKEECASSDGALVTGESAEDKSGEGEPEVEGSPPTGETETDNEQGEPDGENEERE